jgi:hypothetical protein
LCAQQQPVMEPTLPTRTKYSPAAVAELLSTKTRPLATSPGNQELAAARAMARHGMHADNQHCICTRGSDLHANYLSLLKECKNVVDRNEFLTTTWGDLIDAVHSSFITSSTIVNTYAMTGDCT